VSLGFSCFSQGLGNFHSGRLRAKGGNFGRHVHIVAMSREGQHFPRREDRQIAEVSL
jgi:hypothetical protein